MSRVALAVLFATVALALGCDDEVDPEKVPFEGIDPSAEPNRVTVVPKPGDSAAGGAAPAAPKPSPNQAQVSVVQQCCNALRAAAKRATDDGTRAVNEQAAEVCAQKAQEVRVGKTTTKKALSAVRGSLLTTAPAACNN
jgi:hypothetical protein